ncbi:MAG: Divergent polysaccharide deacetylase [Firmicutes bacterium ADurb.Bin193]|nr:MAG: Divergent polysaccharide deacetylase [Firmicutes bacterium ADurb.Bin193]
MKGRFFIIRIKDLIYVAAVTVTAVIFIVFLLGIIADADTKTTAKLAIILDDFGQARDGVDVAMGINRKLTCAIMPFLEFTEKDMKAAAAAGHEVIIHIPLQNGINDNVKWVGENAIKTTYTDNQVRDLVTAFINNIPAAVGANIHMGSLGSADRRIVKAIMKTLYERGLYFIDSKTNARSVCSFVAEEVGINFSENDVFLESKGGSEEDVKKLLMAAARIAKKTGKAFAIGHVGAENGATTANVIKDSIGEIEKMGVELVYASEIIK